MTDTKIKKAADKAHYLDSETRELLGNVRKKNSRALMWFTISWSIVVLIGVIGIIRQDQIAEENQHHIDCIVKLFSTPLPVNAHSRVIKKPSSTCDIQFTQ